MGEKIGKMFHCAYHLSHKKCFVECFIYCLEKKSKNRKKLIKLKLWSVVLSVTCASLLNESLYKKSTQKQPKSGFQIWIFGSLDFSPLPPKTSCVLINCVLSV